MLIFIYEIYSLVIEIKSKNKDEKVDEDNNKKMEIENEKK